MVEPTDNSELRKRCVNLFCASRKYKEEADAANAMRHSFNKAYLQLTSKCNRITEDRDRIAKELEYYRDFSEWAAFAAGLFGLLMVMMLAALFVTKG